MRISLPKTMTGLVAAGSLLAALPLFGALLFAELALQRLSHQTEALLDKGVSVSQLGMQLRDELGNLERGARQYAVLRDPSLLELIERRWRDTTLTLQSLQARSLDAPVTMIVARIDAGLKSADEAWKVGGDSVIDAASRIHALLPEADTMIAASNEQVDKQVRALRAATRRARAEMTILALTLIPLGALLAWGFSTTVTRPVKQMFRAIAALGHGRYEPAVIVKFPREMRRLGEQIDWLRRRLVELEEDKDRFLQQVSHELKTPLASLREGAELLREGALGELTHRQMEVANILSESTGELESLIDNLLAYAEWRAERQQAQKAWFDVHMLIDEVLAVHRLPLAKREVEVELEVKNDRLFGLRSQLRVALDNLITNAIKHSPRYSVIQISVAVVDGRFVVAVRDHGRGVLDAEKDSIFEPFVRGTEREEQGIRGTGIGLAIVRETVRAHGGTVSVDDAGPGACFRMAWPCPADA